MAVSGLNSTASYADFFQKRLETLLRHWCNHPAVQEVQITVLDREREVIFKAISLGLDCTALWSLVRPLIVAFTPYMERCGHWEAWHTLLQRAIGVTQKVSDLNGETTLTALLARLSQRMSRPQDVVYYYRRSLRLARQTGNRYEEARACSNLGFLYVDRGNWWRSEVLSRHALAIFEALDSDHGRAHTHNHLGMLHTRKQQWEDAEQHLMQACSIWQQQKDDHSLLYGLLNLGMLYDEQVVPQKAIDALSKAVQIAETSGEQSLLGSIFNNLSIAYRLNQDYATAVKVALSAEKILQKFSLNLELAQVWHNLGLIHEGMGQLFEAKRCLENSRQMYLRLNHKNGVIQIDGDMSRLNG